MPQDLTGSSLDSFEDAVENAIQENPRQSNHRTLHIDSLWVTEGGVVGKVQYHVKLTAFIETASED